MKQLIAIFLFAGFYLIPEIGFTQLQSTCTNLDFEAGNFIGWTGRTGSCCPISMFSNGIVTGQHTIMSGPGFDPHSNNQIPVVAPGGVYSARLGNDNTGAEAEQLSYSFQVTPQTELFIYRYAVVLEDPVHDPLEQPRFEIRVYDQNGNPVGCGTYNVVSGAGIPGFQTWFDMATGSDIHFKTWTTVGIELSSYMGQTVTIEFSTGDCSLGGHFGYAYVDAYCSPLTISSDYCPGSSTATLIAPPGFASYLWSNGATSQQITVNNPVVGATYSVQMTSVTGCVVTLNQVISVTQLFANFRYTPACQNGTRFFDSSYVVTGSAINQWLWDFGDGTTSTIQNPSHYYSTPGNYNVQLTATNAGGCVKSITKTITVLPAPISDFAFIPDCPKQPVSFTQSASFAQGTITGYQWNFGDGSSVVTTPNPQHNFSGAGPYNVSLVVTGSNGCTDTSIQSVASLPKPVAGFTFNVQCQSNQVVFTDTSKLSGGNITSWQWNFGDGSPISNLANPTHNYLSGGTYNVQLIVTGSNGCTDTITKGVAMAVFPQAAFTNSGSCEQQFTAFSDASTLAGGAISSWLWYFGDGTNTTLQNPYHQFATAGNYTVSLVVLGNNGCTDSTSRTIVVKPSPLATFTSVPVCPGQSASFTGTSSVPSGQTLTSWIWNFGDGSPQVAGQNATHTYNAAGTYDVTYVITSSNGCIDSVVTTIATAVTPVAKFSAPSGCAGAPLSFSSASTVSSGTITAWQWDFGDGSPLVNIPSVTHSYANPGSYNVYLTVTSNNGCNHTVFHEASVSAKPSPSFTNTLNCKMDSVHLVSTSTTLNGSISYLKWDFGDGSYLTGSDNVYHIYNDSGFYHVGLIVGNTLGCNDTSYRNVYVKPLPNARFRWDEICQLSPANFYDSSSLVNGTISSWLWDFGTSSGTGASPQNIFTNSGPQTVSLSVTGSNGCKASVSSTVMVHPKPSSVFQINTGCVNSQTVLNNISSISGGNIQSFQWNYGDGHTGQTFNGANTYSAAGYYPVQLIATSDFGCKDTSIDTIRIYPLPVANFYAPNVCMGNPTLFNDLSSAVSDSLISWHWDFGDGQTATQPNPSHIFADDTIYSVTLTVQNEGQCIRSITKNTLILALPKVGFTYTHPCMGSPVQFQDTSFLAGQSIMSWNWNMGDNTHSTISAPLHTYQQYGSVLVSLIVKASNGCSDSVTVPIVVNQLPEASFSANEVCEQAPLVVTNNSYLAGGGIDATLWLWGDNTTDTIFTPIHYYTDYGDYNVQLVVTGSNGCVNDTSVMVRIHDNPVAAFTHSNACQLAPITFNNNASVFNDTIQTSSWVFGDGNASSQFDAVNNYISYGVYNVVLTVNSGFGCIDSVSLPVTIAPKPQAYFHSENVCFQQPMYFFDSSLVSIGSIISHQWNFGDGTTATDINPVHLFNSTGNQTISLVVTTINQCMDTLQRIFRVYELPEAQFISDINEGCQPLWVQYSDSSQANEGNIIKWIWNFDNTYSDYTATPPATLYDQAGLFSPALIVQTDLGCKDTLMIQDYIHVFPKPEAGFSTEPSVTTILHPVVDIIDQSWGATEWLYDFNDSTTSTDQNPVHWYQRPAQYMIMQYITSADGCKDTTFAYLEIKNDFTCYIPNSFTPNGDGINETWNASGIGISDFIIQVFNRWGQLVFSSDQIGKGWDGNYMGQKAKQDVYIYKAAIRDIFNNQHVYTGNVNLIR